MPIRKVDVSEADKKSAQVFFDALFGIYDLKEARVLDAFARNGQLTVNNIAKRTVGSLECWELQEEHREDLRQYTGLVYIGDSYKFLEGAIEKGRQYGLIVIDTPQGLHKDSKGVIHAEHFDFFRQSLQLIAKSAIVVLYVNKSPYDKNVEGSQGYDEYPEYDFKEWMKKRIEFYGVEGVSESGALRGYQQALMDSCTGLSIKSVLQVPCFSDVPGKDSYSYRLALELVRL